MRAPSYESDRVRAARRLIAIRPIAIIVGWVAALVTAYAQGEEFPLRRLPAIAAEADVLATPVYPSPPAPFPAPAAPALVAPVSFASDSAPTGFEQLPFYAANPPVADAVAAPAAPPEGGYFRLASLQDPETEPEKKQPEQGAATTNNGEPQTLGREPVSYTMQFLRDETVLLDPGAWQFDTGFAYTLFENDFPVSVVDGGRAVIGVVEGLARQRLLYSPFALRYGLTCNAQLFAAMPVGWANTQISTVSASDGNDTGGVGDLTAGINYHVCQGDGYAPDVIASGSFTAPTGDFNTPIFGLVPGSALGLGFWAAAGQLLFIHRYDPIIVFYGGGYRHLFERHFDDVLFTAGEQISYQFGVGFAANDRVTLSAILQGFYITSTSLDGVNLPGTNLEPISLRFAATIARNSRILEPFAIIGMTESAPAASVGMVVTFY